MKASFKLNVSEVDLNKRRRISHLYHIVTTTIVCFILAGLTGFLFRLGIIIPLPEWLALDNIRHAHSHLMFFCWAVPLPMIAIVNSVFNESGIIKEFKNYIWAILIPGIGSYPFFLIYGYQPVKTGTMELPLSSILSGIVMIGWYMFVIKYIRKTKSKDSDISISRSFYDGALFMLVFSSMGAWGVAVVQYGGYHPLLGKALTHFFLTVFTDGWCILLILGIAYDKLNINRLAISKYWLILPILVGVPLMFPLGLSDKLLTMEVLIMARVGAFLTASGLILNGYVLLITLIRKNHLIWIVPVLLLYVKCILLFGTVLLPDEIWLGNHNLKIIYLHITLLGIMSLSMFIYLTPALSEIKIYRFMEASVLLLLFSLILYGYVLPFSTFGMWIYYLMTVTALLPVMIALYWIVNTKWFNRLKRV